MADMKRGTQPLPKQLSMELQVEERPLIFVVHKHAASHLHYDLRLELDGVLASWAVPNGPSLNPEHRRLAIRVRNHRLSYSTFEGVTPKGHYGAGQVIVWDRGSYQPGENTSSTWDREEGQEYMRRMLKGGEVSFTLCGTKLQGSWKLAKIREAETQDKESFHLIKAEDSSSDSRRDVLTDGRSVISGRTIEDLKEGT